MEENESARGTLAHKAAVDQLGTIFLALMEERFKTHDDSKLEEPEVSILNKMAKAPEDYSNGSWGDGLATGRLDTAGMELRNFLRHHYKVNRHHPEHYDNGIDGMTLLDVVEMFFDWMASTIRTEDGNIYRSIQYNEKRFKVCPQLTRIFMNTALDYDEVLREIRKSYTE